jgi:hypothetical protein
VCKKVAAERRGVKESRIKCKREREKLKRAEKVRTRVTGFFSSWHRRKEERKN